MRVVFHTFIFSSLVALFIVIIKHSLVTGEKIMYTLKAGRGSDHLSILIIDGEFTMVGLNKTYTNLHKYFTDLDIPIYIEHHPLQHMIYRNYVNL